MEETAVQKTHRERQAGRKAEKKKSKDKKQDENLTDRQRNPKAFAFHSAANMAKSFRRNMDLQSKRHHIPVVDRTPLEPPPVVVVVVGPPKVGKSTLIRCLIRNYTRQNLVTIQGPVTIVSGKKRRLTFIECNNDINSMIDLAKVADLVLLLVDASFGFEMEVFEFLNIVQIHGFPKIMGVLTHLDQLKNNKTLKKTKKRLKNRFWTEIYQGAKLFYLSGMIHTDYQQREIHNLGRFISVMKFRPLVWRSTHPYMLADRMEDLTDPENIRQDPNCDRTVSFYGYVRGTPLKRGSSIHVAGCGDFQLKDISYLADPCPLPEKEKKRSLNQKERLIYAPLSGVGGIVYDKDVVYIDLGNKTPHSQVQQNEDRASNELVTNLISTQHTIDTKMAASKLAIFPHSTPITSEHVTNHPEFRMPGEVVVREGGRVRRRAVFGDNERGGDDSGHESSNDEEEEEEEDSEEGSDDDDDDEEEVKPNPLLVGLSSDRKVKRQKLEEEEEEEDSEEGSDDDNDEEEVKPNPQLVGSSSDRKVKRLKLDLTELSFADSDDDLEIEPSSFTPTNRSIVAHPDGLTHDPDGLMHDPEDELSDNASNEQTDSSSDESDMEKRLAKERNSRKIKKVKPKKKKVPTATLR